MGTSSEGLWDRWRLSWLGPASGWCPPWGWMLSKANLFSLIYHITLVSVALESTEATREAHQPQLQTITERLLTISHEKSRIFVIWDECVNTFVTEKKILYYYYYSLITLLLLYISLALSLTKFKSQPFEFLISKLNVFLKKSLALKGLRKKTTTCTSNCWTDWHTEGCGQIYCVWHLAGWNCSCTKMSKLKRQLEVPLPDRAGCLATGRETSESGRM